MSFDSFIMQTNTEYNVTDIYSIQERYMSDKKNTEKLPEWITTRQAQDILKVTTTQGVWNVMLGLPHRK